MERTIKVEGTKVFFKPEEFKNYKKKPIVIQALQIDKAFQVYTLEGVMKGDPGDFLIIGVKGEPYPCKPDIFAETYEEVKE